MATFAPYAAIVVAPLVLLCTLWRSGVEPYHVGFGRAHAADVYRCRDDKGRVMLSDVPCGPDRQTDSVKRYEDAPDRARQWEKANPSPVSDGVRKINCQAYLSAATNLDPRALDAAKRRDETAQKAVIVDRRRIGAALNKYGANSLADGEACDAGSTGCCGATGVD